MLYARSANRNFGGHDGGHELTRQLNNHYTEITEIQADGDELVKCCEILGRNLPKRRVYTFIGPNAQEIACNWDSK